MQNMRSIWIDRQRRSDALKRDESVKLGAEFDYDVVVGLSNEVRSKLNFAKPENLGQAGGIGRCYSRGAYFDFGLASQERAGRRNDCELIDCRRRARNDSRTSRRTSWIG